MQPAHDSSGRGDIESSPGEFVTTHWSIVLAAGETASPQSADALEKLCREYWYPLYVYVRRKGHNQEDAQDLVQEFFARFLERKYFQLADRSRGRFRTFLLTALQHFLVNEWKQANRQKRGGGLRPISINGEDTEVRYLAEELADKKSPDKAYEHHWAMTLLGRVLDQLQAELVSSDRGHVFNELKCFLTGEKSDNSYAEIGSRLGMNEGALKVMVHRLRARYRELLRNEVSQTVESPELIEEEIRELKAALRGS